MELNIFTDASIIKTIYGETIGCSGAICEHNNSISAYYISRDSTNNIAELSAIQLGVQLAIENRNMYSKINIWSDSQFCIFGLTKWIRSWYNNSQNYVLKNSSGEDVKNQQIFLSIIKTIVDNNISINFNHIKGHVNVNDLKSLNHAVSVFNKANNKSISRDRIYKAAQMNNMVDNNTRQLLSTYMEAPLIKMNRGFALPIVSNKDMIRYYNLVTLGGNKI